jgi:hypothetical protein
VHGSKQLYGLINASATTKKPRPGSRACMEAVVSWIDGNVRTRAFGCVYLILLLQRTGDADDDLESVGAVLHGLRAELIPSCFAHDMHMVHLIAA